MTRRVKNRVGSLNSRAVAKTVIIVIILFIAFSLHFPLGHVAKLWVEDVEYHMSNNTTWNAMSSKQKMAWIFIPGYYMVGLFVFYGTLYRTHRKRLYINGLEEGTVMYIHGSAGVDSNIYDLACILFNWFRHMTPESIPRPISGNFYQVDGKDELVIYYKMEAFVAPWRWKRMVIDGDTTLIVGTYSAWVDARYEKVYQHPFNPVLSFIKFSNKTPYETERPDQKRFEEYHERILDRIQRTNVTNLQGNPTIMGPSIRNNIMVQTSDRLKEEWDLLTDQERSNIKREFHEVSKTKSPE